MYETFVKQFIDIMDERAPVTLVRNRMDMPLGAVEADQSTLIHTRLDLTDEASPYADVVITPNHTGCHVDYIAHIPADDQITDESFMGRIQQAGQVDSVSVLHSIDGRHDATYVVTGHMDIDFTNHDQNTNSATHDMSEKIVAIMKAGGYEPFDPDNDSEAEDLVAWSPE
ncbi:hypothetical protein [Effusibacillus lacus]|uniref:Uncharacterized protein n=1 Tax=Effusibacillus lacus TaxID=1348429 RepID=A0A292YJY0_9BACL|nr:hypothetical protein [Effusibacillus lacus]TCS72865.1 hypothetical protein EDD64_12081 [Effusibacillus lacus]GAX89209.1 hypothetical protein EFBL_0827 [Effusibacillus lacus]